MSAWLMMGDCLEQLRLVPEGTVDAVVTDPPYGLSFMGKKWDYDVPSVDVWAECLRVLKPGGHLLAFAGTRTQHRMAVRIEDAGFEIRDMIAWIYGSGFPKSLDVSKAIDKAAGAEREVVQHAERSAARPVVEDQSGGKAYRLAGDASVTAATDAARQWQGWGTALKPALEPITVARKPLAGTVAENVQQFGTGALNIDGCRVATDDRLSFGSRELGDGIKYGKCVPTTEGVQHDAGRFPANLIHDGGEPADLLGSAARFFSNFQLEDLEWLAQNLHPSYAGIAEQNLCLQKAFEFIARVVAASAPFLEGMRLNVWTEHSMTATPSELREIAATVIPAILSIGKKLWQEWRHINLIETPSLVNVAAERGPTDTMTIIASLLKSDGCAGRAIFVITPDNSEAGEVASRFKYCAKASKADRDAGLAELEEKEAGIKNGSGRGFSAGDPYAQVMRKNNHPTVKPTDLMRYLCRLVTPPGGVVLDPFMGSGSTGRAARLEGFQFIGIERDPAYFEIAQRRVNAGL